MLWRQFEYILDLTGDMLTGDKTWGRASVTGACPCMELILCYLRWFIFNFFAWVWFEGEHGLILELSI